MSSTATEEVNYTVCEKGHHHFPTCWTVYVVEPEANLDVKGYGSNLHAVAVFDTKEEAEELYKTKECFHGDFGPPSWSMVIPGAAIAVFRGGDFGFKPVKPEWDDPATLNGYEIRFRFTDKVDPLKCIDAVFLKLVNWMANHKGINGTMPLGLFVKNVVGRNITDFTASDVKRMNLQIRLWISEVDATGSARTKILTEFSKAMEELIRSSGGVGDMRYEALRDLKDRAENPEKWRQDQENRQKKKNGFDANRRASAEEMVH